MMRLYFYSQMKTHYQRICQAVLKKLFIIQLLCFAVLLPNYAKAQLCDSITPVFTVNLAGDPMGTWISPAGKRDGLCCGASSPDVCVEFIITLDPGANGIKFDIASGAIPPGALFYQINCGPIVKVGDPVCLNGAGPHHLTFCKPGNNTNAYQITSYPKPSLKGTEYVSQACSGEMSVLGLMDTGITWTSVPYDAIHNGYLNCTANCDTVTITHPGGSAPPYVDYQVCGYILGGCNPVYFCDTLRVNFVNDLGVNITPQNPTICFGGTPATVTANSVGGLAPYSFLWNTGATTQSISVTQGTYSVQLTDAMGCSIATDTVIVNALPSVIAANAGPDQLMCDGAQVSVLLNGSYVASAGAQWMGGTGTFSPNDATMNAVYTPSQNEINAGGVNLSLITTGNSGCPPDTDIVHITIGVQPMPSIAGPSPVCAYSTQTYSTPAEPNVNYNWTVTGGVITSVAASAITVRWNNVASGIITLTATHSTGCDSVVSRNITVNPTPLPVIQGPLTSCVHTTNTYNLQTATSNAILWSVTGGQIVGANNATSVNILWNTPGTGTITVTETTSLGCDSSATISVNIGQTSIPVITGPNPVCAYSVSSYSTPLVANTSYTWSVAGGTIISNSGTAVSIRWNAGAAGTITLTASNSSGCDSTVSQNITVNPTPVPVITGPVSVCMYNIVTYALQTASANTKLWTVAGGQIIGASIGNSIIVHWNTAGTGSVSVTETNSLGCDSTATISVTVGATSIPQINGANTVCAYSATSYSTPLSVNTTYSWSVTGGSIIANSGTSISIRWNAGPSGTITLTASNASGCDSTITQNIVINPTPTPTISGPTSACTHTIQSYFLQTTSGNSISWYVTGGQIIGASTGNSINVEWTTAGTGTVSVTETHALGCDSTVAITVNVGQTSIPQINGPATLCAYSTSSYYTPLWSNTTYTWNVTGGTIVSNNTTSIIVTWGAGTVGTITLTASNASGCDSTIVQNIIINPTPTPAITGVPSACTHTTGIYSLQNATSNSVQWSVTGGQILGSATSNSIQVLWNNPGNNIVRVTESNSLGCDSTVTFAVAVGMTSVPQINGPSTVCAYSTSSYYTPVWSNTTYTWTVSGGTIVTNTGPSITVKWDAVPAGSIMLTAANSSGCDSTVVQNMIINPTPVPVIIGASANCTQTTDYYGVANPTTNTYAWTVSGGIIVGPTNLDNITVQWTTAGLGKVTVTETNSLGCDSTVSQNVQLNAKPWPSLSGNPQVCEMDTATYSVPYVAGHNYIWNVVGGGIIGFSVSNSIDVYWYAPGAGSVSCQQISPEGCDSLVDMTVNISARPAPYVTSPPVICADKVYTYSVILDTSNTYNWFVNGGTILNGTTGASVDVRWGSAGLGDLTVTETSPMGCANMVNTQFQIFPRPAPVISGSNVGCISPLSSNYSVTTEPGVYYAWNVTGGAIVAGNGSGAIDIRWTIPGTHTITLIATDINTGCDSITSKEVKVDSLGQISVAAPNFQGCVPMDVTFSGNQVNTSYSYNWSFGDGTTSTAANPSHNYDQPGTYTVKIYATNSTGCADSAQAQVVVYPSPTAAFVLNTTTDVYYAGVSEFTLTNNSTGAIQYEWDFGNGDTSMDFEPQYQYVSPGVYTITMVARNSYGCTDTANAILDVRVPEDIYVPNAFTPNGDAANDYFSVAERNITALKVFIYNKWGAQIYSSNQVDFAWDGTFKGEPVQQDVYVYLIKATGFHGKTYDLKGTVTVVR